jgi:DNA-binding NtrC family response regulator
MDVQTIKTRFGIIGNSSGLHHAISIAERVAATQLTVLITGESGVGKEVFSQIIHQLGNRKHHPFIAVNCGAIPEGTIDSELFGHEKGAFTGAHDARKGYFETVSGGSIFLDEVGELPLGTQARLLRVLETGEYIRVGASKVLKTDVRVIAATNVDLKEAVRSGRFREDLYYRLNTVPIQIPPLRERGDDIYFLFKKFVSDFCDKNKIRPLKLDDEARILILRYPWPGNVRQLKNVAEQVSILASGNEVTAEELIRLVPDITDNKLPAIADKGRADHTSGSFTEREILYKLIFDLKQDLNDLKQFVFDVTKNRIHEDLPSMGSVPIPGGRPAAFDQPLIMSATDNSSAVVLSPSVPFNSPVMEEESLSLADKERELIARALKKHRNKRKDAALDLGISERTLYRKIKEYNLE